MKKLFLNTIMPIILQIVLIASNLILPRQILLYFGSEVNGLVESITQFLTVISFMEMGVGSVVRYNLYKPLASNDSEQLSRVVVSANKFFHRLAMILAVYVLILMILYPYISSSKFGHIYTALLIAAISISYFSQYYFGQVNQLILSADQRGYIQYTAQIITVILNTVVGVILIISGAGIHFFKLSTSLIFLMRPLFLYIYVRKHYHIDYMIKVEGEPIEQKWNGVAQHISAVILDSTDVIVLTMFSSLSNVSIYTAYRIVVAGLKSIMTSSTNGIEALLGNLIAHKEEEKLRRVFSTSEWIIHTAATFIFGCSIMLIVPFVLVYTLGVTDANYNVPLFGILLTIAYLGHSYRLPYSITILSAGHYKKTQSNYFIASIMNIVISIILVWKYGLIGVAIGTICAMYYQTIWMANYCYKKIISKSISRFIKQMLVDVCLISVSVCLSFTVKLKDYNYGSWILCAVVYAVGYLVVIVAVNYIAYNQEIKNLIRWVSKRRENKQK